MKISEITKIAFISTLLGLISCNEKGKESPLDLKKDKNSEIELVDKSQSDLERFRPIFEKNIIALFNNEGTNLDSNKINFQTYINEKDVEFLPIFTSKENLLKSTGGITLGNELELNGFFFLSYKSGFESVKQIRINPSLNDDIYVSADDLTSYFKNEINQKFKEIYSK